MKWRGRRRSSNIEDRRGSSGKKFAVGGGIGGVIILVLYMIMGGDPSALIDQNSSPSGTYQPTAQEEELAYMVEVVLADTEEIWQQIFTERGDTYREPILVYFSGSIQSACGSASSATGPFYCPADEKVYIDLSFYQQMKTQLNAPGDFAMAYVVAHEVGHHVQNLLGISRQVQQMRGQVSENTTNFQYASSFRQTSMRGYGHIMLRMSLIFWRKVILRKR